MPKRPGFTGFNLWLRDQEYQDLRQAVREHAAKTKKDITMTDILRSALREFVRSNKENDVTCHGQ